MADSSECRGLWRYRLRLRTHKHLASRRLAATRIRCSHDTLAVRTNKLSEENRSSNSELLANPPEAWPNPPENTPPHRFITICHGISWDSP
eukprot:s1287_g1.t1